ncbi:MAG: enolase C-terminal domain-like protein [Candidatus Pelethousia sp.]|nr:enolase C-terminal domain-like protein [Candidatus Pelethousia sp.]
MRIKKIILHELQVPLKHPYVLSREYGVQAVTTPIVAEVQTDEGLVGYGECDPWPLFTGDSAASSMVVLSHHLAPQLIGKDPTNIHEIHRNMDAMIRGNHISKSALDMAAYDLFGKSAGLPVHQLLGGKRRNEIKCFWSVGGGTPEETAQEILAVKKQGYYGCMIKIGTANYRNDIARTLAAREAVGPDFPLVADANQGWDVDTAILYGRAVEKAALLFFEQPVQSWDVQGMARIRRAINVPVSADEGVATVQDAVHLVRAEAVDVLSIKVTKHGGILPAKEICDYAATSGIKLFFNSMLEEGITQAASLCVAATVPNLMMNIGHSYFSPLRLDGDISDFHTRVINGVTHISDAPGLGIQIDEEALAKYTVNTCSVE